MSLCIKTIEGMACKSHVNIMASKRMKKILKGKDMKLKICESQLLEQKMLMGQLSSSNRTPLLKETLEKCASLCLPHTRQRTRAAKIHEALVDRNDPFFCGIVFNITCEWSNKMNREFFSGWKLLQVWDTNEVVTINLGGITSLRSVEKLEKFERGSMLHGGTVCHYARKLESESSCHVKMTICPQDGGEDEVIYWNYEEHLRYVLKHYGLEEKARTHQVDMGAAFDGASLTEHLHFVALGLKVVDDDTIYPHTNQHKYVLHSFWEDLQPPFKRNLHLQCIGSGT